VVVGPKGIGKSTLAAAAVWELLSNYEIGLVARVDVLDSENSSEFTTFIENYGERFSEYFGRLLILYDPVSTETYEREPSTQQGRGALAKTGGGVRRVRYVKMPRDVEVTIANLINASSELGDLRPPILIVLPSDIYNALSEEVKNALEVYRLDVSQALSDREFLAGLIREYTRTSNKPNGCELSNDVLSKLAGELAKFDSGHALIARLVGEELARNNCDVGKIEELISKAKGKAEAFIILQINGLFKVRKNTNTAKALVEIFALREPFVDEVGPGEPILTPGIVELIGEERRASLLQGDEGEELRGWLARRQHDLIEDSIGELLRCVVNDDEECKEKLGTSLKPWRLRTVRKSLREISEKVRDEVSAVDYFVSSYGEKLTEALKDSSNCWRRAALIIGHALAGYDSVPKPEDLSVSLPENLRKSVIESLGDALSRCGVDDYLLIDNKISPLTIDLVLNYVRVLTKAFVDKYDEVIGKVKRVLKNARNRGGIYSAEAFYGLGLASIIAGAAESDKPVKSGHADVALRIALFTIKGVILPILIVPILSALRPLRDKAPQRYIELPALTLEIENLDHDIVGRILNELNEVLDNYGNRVKKHAWSLAHAINAYVNLLGKHRRYFSDETEIEDVVGRVADLLNELGRFKSSLGVITWAHALDPALGSEDVRRLMEEKLGINVVDKASEVLGELGRLRDEVQDLMKDEEFMGYVESKSVKADEKAVKTAILEAASHLKHALAYYRLENDELEEAAKLFNEAAEENREIGDYEDYLIIGEYENYLIARGWALRAEAIKGSLVGDELVNGFRQLYEETFNEERFKFTASYLSTASHVLDNYLVSLALINDVEEIRKLPEKHWRMLNADKQVSILTRLTLNALFSPKGGLGGELDGRLNINLEELIDAFRYEMSRESLPALMAVFEVAKPEDVGEICILNIDNSIKGVGIVCGDSAIKWLRGELINDFREQILGMERLDWLKELNFNADAFVSEFEKLLGGLDGVSLIQLDAPRTSTARLALMLYALINGNEELAKAHALIGIVEATGNKLLRRLLLEAYRACCDLGKDEFRRAIAKLFFYHV
jgi:tetratricopeptide (TPR) repeat protein